jgi:hypothetical protein
MHSFIQLIHSLIPSILSLTDSFIHSFYSIHSLVHAFIHPFIRSLIHRRRRRVFRVWRSDSGSMTTTSLGELRSPSHRHLHHRTFHRQQRRRRYQLWHSRREASPESVSPQPSPTTGGPETRMPELDSDRPPTMAPESDPPLMRVPETAPWVQGVWPSPAVYQLAKYGDPNWPPTEAARGS